MRLLVFPHFTRITRRYLRAGGSDTRFIVDEGDAFIFLSAIFLSQKDQSSQGNRVSSGQVSRRGGNRIFGDSGSRTPTWDISASQRQVLTTESRASGDHDASG